MKNQNPEFIRELGIPTFYQEKETGRRRVDFLVQDKVLLELKAVARLEKTHLAQGLNYLEAFKLEIGLLKNFGSTKLAFKRLTLEEKLKSGMY